MALRILGRLMLYAVQFWNWDGRLHRAFPRPLWRPDDGA